MSSAPYADYATHTLRQQMREASTVGSELQQLLVKHKDLIGEDNRQQIEGLEQWLRLYRLGLEAAENISQTGIAWLAGLEEKLKLDADAMQRLESEGGSANGPAQIANTEETLNAVQRIEREIWQLLQHATEAA